MKRLEHIRTLRNQTSRFQAKNPTGAVMVLGQVCQERHRLEQEREHWRSRIQRIDARLREIARLEQQLLAKAKLNRRKCRGPEGNSRSLPAGFTEFTMRY